jgi:hypothetical protein
MAVVNVGAAPECLPCCGGPPVPTGCCPDNPVPRTVNFAIGAGCPNLAGLTGTVTYRTSGPYAGSWASDSITLTGCVDSVSGNPIPDITIIVTMSLSADGTVCCADLRPVPADQGDCLCEIITGGTLCVLQSLTCSPFSMAVTLDMAMSCFCPGPSTNHYCGNSTFGIHSIIPITFTAP